jgi:hypothetical protein
MQDEKKKIMKEIGTLNYLMSILGDVFILWIERTDTNLFLHV